MKPRVLIACEFSGVVRDAFTRIGAYALSCDLLPTEKKGEHYQGDISNLLGQPWDLMVAFPPCTHLCSSGAVYWATKQKDGRQEEAIWFFKKLYNADIPRVACENPSGILSTVWRKPDQYINPYQFGEPYRKRTGLWLKNLPLLKPTNIIDPIASWHSGATRGGKKKDGTRTPSKYPTMGKYSGKERSRSFKGIANAMAEQWYPLLEQNTK